MSSSDCSIFFSAFSMFWCLSWNVKGLVLFSGSTISDFFRLIDFAWDESSIYYTCIVLFPDIGIGTGGLRHALLNLMMNMKPPMKVPTEKPPGRLLCEDLAFWRVRTMDRPPRYEHSRTRTPPGTCMACRSSMMS